MKSLKVTLNYSSTDYRPDGQHSTSRLALPLRVLDSEGGLVAEGVASSSHPAVINVPETDSPMFVRLTWPSGKTQTKKVSSNSVSFGDEQISRNEWSAWAVPRLNENTPLAQSEPSSTEVGIDRYSRVWLRLWQFKTETWQFKTGWSTVPIVPKRKNRNAAAIQLDFNLDARSWCLQLGGANVPWRLVSLPGSGACRVLLTPNDSTDPRAQPVKVIVTGFRPDAETLLEFLSRDSLRAARSVATYQPLAVQLLEKKFKDPIAAVAGGYFLLRTEGWRGIPVWWFDNLTNMFPWIPDAAIIRCVVMLRSGLSSKRDVARAQGLLAECLNRGVPIFAEGLSLLQEAASVLNAQSNRQGIFGAVESLTASQAWAGAAFSFYGKDPSAPSPAKIFGTPKATPTANRKRRGIRGSRALQAPAEQRVMFLGEI